MSTYAWIIDKDWLAFDLGDESYDDTGTTGPNGASTELVYDLITTNRGREFRMYDGDDELMYSGRLVIKAEYDHAHPEGFELAPLDDFGMPNAGATTIKYFQDGAWVEI